MPYTIIFGNTTAEEAVLVTVLKIYVCVCMRTRACLCVCEYWRWRKTCSHQGSNLYGNAVMETYSLLFENLPVSLTQPVAVGTLQDVTEWLWEDM